MTIYDDFPQGDPKENEAKDAYLEEFGEILKGLEEDYEGQDVPYIYSRSNILEVKTMDLIERALEDPDSIIGKKIERTPGKEFMRDDETRRAIIDMHRLLYWKAADPEFKRAHEEHSDQFNETIEDHPLGGSSLSRWKEVAETEQEFVDSTKDIFNARIKEARAAIIKFFINNTREGKTLLEWAQGAFSKDPDKLEQMITCLKNGNLEDIEDGGMKDFALENVYDFIRRSRYIKSVAGATMDIGDEIRNHYLKETRKVTKIEAAGNECIYPHTEGWDFFPTQEVKYP